MVKFINTPFGEYGYVLNRDIDPSQQLNVGLNKMSTTPRPIQARASTYDAKYLRTTSLAKGSQVFTVNDPNSYLKHGLLHKGQEPFVALETQFSWKKSNALTASADLINSRNRSTQSKHANVKLSPRLSKSVQQNCLNYSKASLAKHAGKSTVSQQHIGFAKSYAASRADLGSLAGVLGSGGDEQLGSNEEDEHSESNNIKINKKQLLQVDSKQMPFSKLDKLKSQRLFNIYTDMYKKHDEARQKLIMDRVKTAEKLKEDLHRNELEEQRNIRKSSKESQCLQLRELRSKYKQNYETRLHSLYSRHSSPSNHASVSKMALSERHLFQVPVPRQVYGLPENDKEEVRPDTTPTRRIFRFPPGKLSLTSYHKARENIPLKFNNVWNLTTVTPRKSVA